MKGGSSNTMTSFISRLFKPFQLLNKDKDGGHVCPECRGSGRGPQGESCGRCSGTGEIGRKNQ